MQDINLIDRSLALAIRFEHRSLTGSDTGVVIDSETLLSRTCKTSLLFAPLAIRVHANCSAVLFYTPTKPLIRLHVKNKTIFP